MFRLNYKKAIIGQYDAKGKLYMYYFLSGFSINYVVYVSRLKIFPANQAS